MKAIFTAILLATAVPAAANTEIVLSCQGTKTVFGPTRNDALTENVAGFGIVVDLDKKEVRWTTEFSINARHPITTAGETQIRFSDHGWTDKMHSGSHEKLPSPDSYWSESGTLNRMTGGLEYLGQTTWYKDRGDDVKRGNVFGEKWKMICAP
jgi:hypothetical protein